MNKNTPVILVFDIGKTNKKVIIFDMKLNKVYENNIQFSEIVDDDGFACDDIDRITDWIDDSLNKLINSNIYDVKAVNFSTYGASLVYLDKKGNILTPVYNYLKKIPQDIVDKHYFENEGQEEFLRKTASPALGFLNSGLQIKWLEKEKRDIYSMVHSVLHLPQYLSYRYTRNIVSEPTSIGCHTALWDFDNSTYHKWVKKLDLNIPEPISNSLLTRTKINSKEIKVGIGIHDSSAALVPYLYASKGEFILVSTGTWCISMNPFNNEKLTQTELKNDCLCFLTSAKQQVKSSRFHLGHIHEVNAKRLSEHFDVPFDEFIRIKFDESVILKLKDNFTSQGVFFKNGIPKNHTNKIVDLSQFDNYAEAYHQLIIDLTRLNIKAIELVIPQNDTGDKIYITGGFAKNEIYVCLIAAYFLNKKVYTSETDNASALGAALVIIDEISGVRKTEFDLKLKKWNCNLDIKKFYS